MNLYSQLQADFISPIVSFQQEDLIIALPATMLLAEKCSVIIRGMGKTDLTKLAPIFGSQILYK